LGEGYSGVRGRAACPDARSRLGRKGASAKGGKRGGAPAMRRADKTLRRQAETRWLRRNEIECAACHAGRAFRAAAGLSSLDGWYPFRPRPS
jgi:hypothetical protein